ncbi:hypothetical protein OC835_007335 [Tilletia horrida]|nr:hypothetical protein OC835_007335 [Tilletia horrida]
MPPKQTDEVPKGATTRAAARQEGLAAVAAGPSAPPSMEEKLDKMLAFVDHLGGQMSDLCSRMSALELRSGRTSPSQSPAASAPAAPGTPVASSAPVPTSQSVPHQSQPKTQPPGPTPAVTDQSSISAQGPIVPPSTGSISTTGATVSPPTTQSGPQTGRDGSSPSPWSHWPSDIQNDMRFRLGKHGMTLTQLFAATDGPSSAAAPERDHPPVTSSRQLICKHETLGSFDGDPTKLEGFLSRVRAIGRKRIAGWEDAVIAAVPDALTGQAAKWHASLTEKETAAWTTLDDLIAAMRRAFPINRAQLRSLARQRQWEPRVESAMNYYYDKVLLMRQAFGDTYSEKALAQDVADGLDASMRAYVRLPAENPKLQQLQDAMAEWEPVWREAHAIGLTVPGDDRSTAPSMTRSQSEPAASNSAALTSTPLPAPPPRPPRSEQRQPSTPSAAPQRTSASVGSLSQTYDSSRVVPAANGQPRMYRLPNSTRIMRLNRNCNKCGQEHFDFEHDHLLTAGQIRVAEAAPYDEVDEAELDQTFAHSF